MYACVCAPVCPSVRAQPPGPWAGPGGSRASPRAGGARTGGTHPGPCANACGPGSARLGVTIGTIFCFARDRLLKGRRLPPSPSPFPQMPSAAGLLLQDRPRRPPRPWQLAGPCSALAASSLGAPPNRLLHLLICLKSHRTSRRRSPPGAGEAGPGVCARARGRGGAARPAAGPFVPGAGRARGGPGCGGAGCAHVGRPPTGPRAADSCRVSSLAPPRQHSGCEAGALAPRQPHQN